jgi:uncharacterized cysteine cluster protein YcgN (CxxCxxCC family)
MTGARVGPLAADLVLGFKDMVSFSRKSPKDQPKISCNFPKGFAKERMNDKPFWQTKSLSQLNPKEWESLCDGCGLCCLVRFEDEDTGEVLPTRVHCKLFDSQKCTCTDYENRKKHVPDCIKLTPHNIEALEWMPKSCAYRRLYEGKDLPGWHYLISGDVNLVHTLGVSIKGQTIPETIFDDIEDALDFIAPDLSIDRSQWPNKP